MTGQEKNLKRSSDHGPAYFAYKNVATRGRCFNGKGTEVGAALNSEFTNSLPVDAVGMSVSESVLDANILTPSVTK